MICFSIPNTRPSKPGISHFLNKNNKYNRLNHIQLGNFIKVVLDDATHDPNHIWKAIPNPNPALTILGEPDAGGRTRRILPVPPRERYESFTNM